VSDPEAVQAARRELGRRLKAARLAAGYGQAQLARKTDYSRSTVFTVESGSQNAPEAFWVRCEEALGAGGQLAGGFGEVEQQRLAARREAARRELAVLAGSSGGAQGQLARPAGRGILAASVAEALRAYQELGWPAAAGGDDRLELVTGGMLDALEVPRAAGIVAARWWLHTGGAPDAIRGLASLPSPQESLAVVAAGDRYFFLVEAGACPWAGTGPPGGRAARRPGAVVRWHAAGSRIPAPPGLLEDGQRAGWAWPPPGQVRLADPIALADLLAKAAAVTSRRRQALMLPGGAPVVLAPAPASLRYGPVASGRTTVRRGGGPASNQRPASPAREP
jgi:transcriptional regulator with XRE-family HTH domain